MSEVAYVPSLDEVYLPPFQDAVEANVEHQDQISRLRQIGKTGLRAAVVAGTLISSTFAAEININEMPGHTQAELVYTVIEADLHQQFGPHFSLASRSPAAQAFSQFENSFGASNGFVMSSNGVFRLEANSWTVGISLEADGILSLYRGGVGTAAQSAFKASLAAANQFYYGVQPNGQKCYDPGPVGWNGFANYGGDCLVDDSARIAIEDMPSGIPRAQAVLAMAEHQWANKGGVNWYLEQPSLGMTQAIDTQNTCSAAPVAFLAAQLALATHNQADMDFAKKDLLWLQRLYDPTTGEYFDHVSSNGNIDHSIYTYNQAYPEEAMASIGDIAGAIRSVLDSLAYFKKHHSYGIPQFDAEFFRAADWIAGLVNDPILTDQVQAAERLAINSEPLNPPLALEAAGILAIKGLIGLNPQEFRRLAPFVPKIKQTQAELNRIVHDATLASKY